METINLSKSQFEELNFYKKLVINNLQEEISEDEVLEIKKAKNSKLLTEKEFLDNLKMKKITFKRVWDKNKSSIISK